jgi:hypothetical protein
MMDKVHKPSDSKCYTSSLDLYRLYDSEVALCRIVIVDFEVKLGSTDKLNLRNFVLNFIKNCS